MKNSLLFLLLSCSAVAAAEYRGAEAVLKEVAEKPQIPAPAIGKNPVDQLRLDLRAFSETHATLNPDEAGKRWLTLADRLGAFTGSQLQSLDNQRAEGDSYLSFQSLLQVLPPPPSWDAMAKAVEDRPLSNDAAGVRTILLRLTAHTLNNNRLAAQQDLLDLERLEKDAAQNKLRARLSHSSSLMTDFLEHSDDGEAHLAHLYGRIDQHEKDPRGFGDGAAVLEIPDLVTLVGEKKTSDLIRRILQTKALELRVKNGRETTQLARRLTVAEIETVAVPPWTLCESLDALNLYEALIKKFPNTTDRSQHQKEQAQTYYLLGLIAAGRVDDAMRWAPALGDKLARSLSHQGLEALEKGGRTHLLVDFLRQILTTNPNLPVWDTYVRFAPKAGKADEMVALVESSARREDLSPQQRIALGKILTDAYLAADRIEPAIESLRREISNIAEARKDKKTAPASEDYQGGLDLARLGSVLQRPEWIEEGLQAVRAALEVPSISPSQRRTTLNNVAAFFMEQGRGPEAEALLAQALALQEPGDNQRHSFSEPYQTTLVRLAALYHQANRPKDVLFLLENSPQWQVRDLSQVTQGSISTDRKSSHLSNLVASALLQLDRKEEARKVLHAFQQKSASNDDAFALLLALEPDNALARLDELFARDPFEERPLIWKAHLLFKQGKLEEAEAAARQAISIDPSDGEQGPGNRMRVYAVLADIREARGDAAEATVLRGAVTAIRLSENADRFYYAGLITRATGMYREALTHFSDAYCIQSRLALRLAQSGDAAGAEEHYRRAYELMPDSFGRVESHCFGCERAFEGERAQSIAERVFTQIAAKTPEKPQVHYLLAYLRFEQDRLQDALSSFREAVRLDPQYLNAWKKLAEVGRVMRLPAAERDAIQLNILRLDPLQRHSYGSATNISDLRLAWAAMETIQRLKAPAPTELYPLPASAKALEIAKAELAAKPRDGSNRSWYSRGRETPTTAAQLIARQPLLEGIDRIYTQSQTLFPK
jgi:tetratricopeptide (TPR) repeat protein